jgi:RNA polymerase sigma-70 factor (ECF subfamily)
MLRLTGLPAPRRCPVATVRRTPGVLELRFHGPDTGELPYDIDLALLAPGADPEAEEPLVDPDRFLPAGHRWAGHWASPPVSWREVPEDLLLSQETMAEVERAVAALPATQQAVLILRDLEGLSAAEACQLLGLTEGNQRVLLHRGRSKVRATLERYLDAAPTRG